MVVVVVVVDVLAVPVVEVVVVVVGVSPPSARRAPAQAAGVVRLAAAAPGAGAVQRTWRPARSTNQDDAVHAAG